MNPNVEDGILIQFSIPRKGIKAVSIPKMDMIAQIQRIRSNTLRDPRIDMLISSFRGVYITPNPISIQLIRNLVNPPQ